MASQLGTGPLNKRKKREYMSSITGWKGIVAAPDRSLRSLSCISFEYTHRTIPIRGSFGFHFRYIEHDLDRKTGSWTRGSDRIGSGLLHITEACMSNGRETVSRGSWCGMWSLLRIARGIKVLVNL